MHDTTIYFSSLGTIILLVVAVVTVLGLRLSDIGARISDMNTSLGARVGETNDTLGARITETSESLGTRIGATNDTLGARIEQLNENLSARITDTNVRVSSLEARMDARFDRLTDEVHGLRTDSAELHARFAAHLEGHPRRASATG